MSLRIDSTEWISGALLIGETGLGVLGSAIPSTGDSGGSYLYNDLSLPADNAKEICGRITTWPASGALTAYEDGSFSFIGADGSYSFAYQLYVDGVATGAPATVSLVVGAATFVVTSDTAASYLLRTAATSDTSASYAIAATITSDTSASYSILTAGAVTSDSSASYSIRGVVQSDASIAYELRGAVQSTLSGGYDIRQAVASDTSAAYAVTSLAVVTSDLAAAYAVTGVAGLSEADIAAIWAYGVRTITGPPAADIAAAVIALAQTTPIQADLRRVTGQAINGAGTEANPWGP